MFILPVPSTRLYRAFLTSFPKIEQGVAASSRRKSNSSAPVTGMTSRNEQQLVTDVLTHWYGSSTVERFDSLEKQYTLWYEGAKEIDDDIRNRFGDDVEQALNGDWDQLIGGSQHPITGELALVVMLDQYTRNIFRGTARAYAGDEKAVRTAESIVTTDRWEEAKKALAITQCSTFLMPFMHQESLRHLDICVEKVSDLFKYAESAGDEAKDVAEVMQRTLEFANVHRDIIAQFGRYPYRNEVLKRASTPEELKFLEKGPRFGQ